MANFKGISLALAAAALSYNAFAGVYEVYSNDYSATNTDWKLIADTKAEIKEGELSLTTTGGKSRSAYLFWGLDNWANVEKKNAATDNYYVAFDFKLAATAKDNKPGEHKMEFNIVCDPAAAGQPFTAHARYSDVNPNDKSWVGNGANWLISISEDQVYNYEHYDAASAAWWINRPDMKDGKLSGTMTAQDSIDARVILSSTEMYSFEMTLDTVKRVADYVIKVKESGVIVKEGTRVIPDSLKSIRPTGFREMCSRNVGGYTFDNVVVGKYVEGDVATEPVATLVEISGVGDWDGRLRKYQINFKKGEELHYKVAEGTAIFIGEDEVDTEGTFEYADIESEANFLTIGTSTTLELWTVVGTTESEHVKIDVVCEKLKLTSPTVTITSVEAGYKKEYQLTVNTDNIPVSVTASVAWKYGDKSGLVPSGGRVTVEGEGVLEMVAQSAGYVDSDPSYEANTTAYVVVDKFDFVNMTNAEKEAYGFVPATTEFGSNRIGGWDDCAEAFWGSGHFTGKSAEPDAEGNYTLTPLSYIKGEDSKAAVYALSSVDKLQQGFFPFKSSKNEKCGITMLNNGIQCDWLIYQYGGLGTAYLHADGKNTNNRDIAFYYPEGCFAILEYTNNYGREVKPRDTLYNYNPEVGAADFIAQQIANGIHYNSASKAVVKIAGYTEDGAAASTWGVYRLSDVYHVITILAPEGTAIVGPGNAPSAIDEKKADVEVEDNTIYNLAGQKMNPANLKKGLYIKNGKAFLVK